MTKRLIFAALVALSAGIGTFNPTLGDIARQVAQVASQAL